MIFIVIVASVNEKRLKAGFNYLITINKQTNRWEILTQMSNK